MCAAAPFFIPRAGFLFASTVVVSRKEPVPMRRTLLAGSTWLLLFCAPLWAQTLGTITGAVKDSSGAVVPGATVTVVNKGTNAARTTSSNEVGLYEFPALPPGLYTVKTELDG